MDDNTLAIVATVAIACYLLTRWWFWFVVFIVGGIAALASAAVSLWHGQVIMALGYLVVMYFSFALSAIPVCAHYDS